MTQRADEVLAYLERTKHRLVSTEELLDAVWGSPYFVRHNVYKTIHVLRSRGHEIRTVMNHGYVLNKGA